MPTHTCDQSPPLPQTAEQCSVAGGQWAPIGIFPAPLCRMPAPDSGRLCGDEGECVSTCLADLDEAQRDQVLRGRAVAIFGHCASHYPIVGCQAVVRRGVVDSILCRD